MKRTKNEDDPKNEDNLTKEDEDAHLIVGEVNFHNIQTPVVYVDFRYIFCSYGEIS